ncbi:low molecular weight protein arginine phosphatase [Desulfosporosinus fructosivorans]|uniref:Low molecular weight protein arginine phosphatase n=1 Tax=Desulfosporosinus fructosivorans TaxID=2018669 RepID=A0A4Z0R145_9FIRM|nr:low molecular weight protein arginine phosphatase [Desulfosporosinus fructosivorans]TGE36711.1 low molecular weight protein arginine phosphatase [Desulfosporosinus fructosivorans]
MGLKLLFICTGNTCRSPMAEGLARKIFGDSVQVGSAGMAAYGGESANTHALEVLKEQNIDLSRHFSRRISAELMADADWIIPMTQAQEEALKRLFPEYAEKVRYLGDWGEQKREVVDPWGGSLEIYRQTAQEIGNLLSAIKSYLA